MAPLKNTFNLPSPAELDDFVAAAGRGDAAAVTEFLDAYPAAVDGQDSLGWTALTTAAVAGRKEMAALLLERGAVIDKKNHIGKTALMQAADANQYEVAALLLEKGAAINEKDKDGWTALMQAVWEGYGSTVMLLLENGADIDVRADLDGDGERDTALSIAQFRHNREMIDILEQWPEKKKHLLLEKENARTQWLEDTDYSKGLKKPLRAPRPLGFKKGL
jgi:ankyrin repeat protein